VVRSQRRNVPPVIEFQVQWKGAYDDSWHEPCDFEHSQDVLQAYLQHLTKPDLIRVLKCFDCNALSRLPSSMQNLI
jgi:hypothetical protein